MKQCRLVLDRTVVVEFDGEVPRDLLRVFTPELFCGWDAQGLCGRRVHGRDLENRLIAAGWSAERASVALGEQIELALEAYAGLAEPVRQRLCWPGESTLRSLDAPDWIRRFATAGREEVRWLGAIAGGTHAGLLLRACLLARPRARATLWLRESRPAQPVPRRHPPRQVASARELLLLQEAAQPAYEGRQQP